MCGIAGFILSKSISLDELKSISGSMASVIQSRGPDDYGTWVNDSKNLAFSHRRLSILDLSSGGHQPMASNSNRYVICYNGEVYNHEDLREYLPRDFPWRGHSDTETILEIIELFGIHKALTLFVGMFAISVWDKKYSKLYLARDRMGEKPLYYGWTDHGFVFGSQLSALKQFPNFNNQISRESLAHFLKLSYVPAPLSIYQDIYKLEPGSFLELDPETIFSKDIVKTKYWDFKHVAETNSSNQISDPLEASQLVRDALKKSVGRQMISDVPLGAFLSGGIDSSLIASLMQEQSNIPIKTFTIGFEELDFDESPYAKKVADYIGTDHSEFTVTAREALDVIPNLPHFYDEPFADSSQIPTYLVCKQARQKVTVAISGDGGDEIFGGYNRYFWSSRIWNKISWMSPSLRKIFGTTLNKIPISTLSHIGNQFNKFAPASSGIDNFPDKVNKMAQRLKEVTNEDELYTSLVSQWNNPSELIRGDYNFNVDNLNETSLEDQASKMMYWDSISYLPDDILCKVDRASMAVSLETRAPFLDHELVELAWRLPIETKIENNTGKIVLRKILNEYIPNNLIDRPKSGFGIPVGDWLRGPLRNWAEELISENKLEEEGIFNYQPIRKAWYEHLSGDFDHTHKIWNILMFQAWLEVQ